MVALVKPVKPHFRVEFIQHFNHIFKLFFAGGKRQIFPDPLAFGELLQGLNRQADFKIIIAGAGMVLLTIAVLDGLITGFDNIVSIFMI